MRAKPSVQLLFVPGRVAHLGELSSAQLFLIGTHRLLVVVTLCPTYYVSSVNSQIQLYIFLFLFLSFC